VIFQVISKKMPKVYAFVSHQVIDVTTLIDFTRRWNTKMHDDYINGRVACTHRAMDDVEVAISALCWFRGRMFVA
jgi:oligoribonuclease (3'-5' exoribonuclease)